MFPKIVVPQIIHFNRVFHYNHPFWGTTIFGNTSKFCRCPFQSIDRRLQEIHVMRACDGVGPHAQRIGGIRDSQQKGLFLSIKEWWVNKFDLGELHNP